MQYIVSAKLALSSMHSSGFHMAAEEEDHPRTPEKEKSKGSMDSWIKMEAAAQNRAGWRRVVSSLYVTGSDKA